MTDATSISAEEVVEILVRVVQIMLGEPEIRDHLQETNFAEQAHASLGLAAAWKAQKMKIIPNFDDMPDQDTLDELHAFYAAIDLADTEDDG